MIKNIKKLGLAVAIACLGMNFSMIRTTPEIVKAETVSQENGFQYEEKDDGTIAITKYVGTDTVVTIPDKINDKKVTIIGDKAFRNCSSLTEISIPEGVITIKNSAFEGCSGLTKINIPEGVTTIGYCILEGCSSLKEINIPNGVTTIETNTFSGCSSLEKINIPEGVTTIGYCAFEGCSSLKEISIPEGVTTIDDNAFYGCSSLKKINIPQNTTQIGEWVFYGCISLLEINVSNSNSEYSSQDGLLYNKDKTKLIGCPEGKKGSIKIPEGVTQIGDNTFSGCSSLTEISIPEGVTTIGYYAFYECSSLTEINIPKDTTEICDWAFNGCISLLEINVSDSNSVYSSQDGLLYNKDKTELIRCPEGKKGSIKIPEGVTQIKDETFSRCSSLTEISIPQDTIQISSWDFYGCTSLLAINVSDSNRVYSSQDGLLYNKAKTELVKCPGGKKGAIKIVEGVTLIQDKTFEGCSSLKEINIPEGVTTIQYNAFEGCSSLEKINIPEGVTTIEQYAFEECSSLEKINIPKRVTTIEYCAFKGCSSLKEINIPEGVTTIGGSVFEGCRSLKEINIPNGVTTIRDDAFNGCSSLKRINIPQEVTEIGYKVFEGCSNLTIYGEENSYAQSYAKKNNIPFKLSSEYAKDSLNDLTTVNKYTVKFINYDGSQIGDIQEVEEGEAAIAPTVEGREGYTFKGWDKDFSNVKSNIEVKAIFEKDSNNDQTTTVNKYTVKFINYDGSQIGDIQEIEEGKAAIAPTVEAREGYIFKGWDKDFSNVKSNIEVKAIFEKDSNNDQTTTVNKYTVKFINYDGSQIGDIQEIEEGKAAIAPTVEAREGYTFKGWDKDFSNVKSNLEVKAVYEENKQSQGDNINKSDHTANSGDIANSGIIAIMILGLAGTIVFKKKHIS